MNDTLGRDLDIISEWGRANRVEFNARKIQCCVLTHKRATNQGASSVYMGGIIIEESESLDVLDNVMSDGQNIYSRCRQEHSSASVF